MELTWNQLGTNLEPTCGLHSSKQNGFKALIYLHRYTPNAIGNLRIDCFHQMQWVYENEIDRM